jgi:hypothetical protein
MNPDRQVESFDMAGAYKTRLGMSASDTWDRLHNPAHGTIPVRPSDVRTRIEFYQLREVYVLSEMRVHGINVGAVSVAGKLENTLRSGAKIAHEIPRGVRVSVANVVRNNQFGFAVQRKPRPNGAPLFRRIGAQPFFMASHEGMHFVGLHQIRTNVPNRMVKQPLAFVSGAYHQIQDRADVQSSYAGDRTHAHAFHHHFEHAGSGVNVSVVRFEFFNRLGEGSRAGLAAPALNAALTEVAELLAGLVLAFGAGHEVSPLAFCGETSQNRFSRSEAWVTPRFGLAPTPVQAEAGALIQLLSVWWRSCHRPVPCFLKRSALVTRGVSHLCPKSFSLFRVLLVIGCEIVKKYGLAIIGQARFNFPVIYHAPKCCRDGRKRIGFVRAEIEPCFNEFFANCTQGVSDTEILFEDSSDRLDQRSIGFYYRVIDFFFDPALPFLTIRNHRERGVDVLPNLREFIVGLLPLNPQLAVSLQLGFQYFFVVRLSHLKEYATMSNISQEKSATTKLKSQWDEAIEDAKLKIAELRKTIEVYQIRRDAGDPWPTTQLNRQRRERHVRP